MTPVSPDEINEMPGVESHFQSDRNFNKIYQSNDEAGQLADLSSVCLNFASKVSEYGGFGSLNRITAYSGDSKLSIFSLNAVNAEPPGPRVFGVKMRSSCNGAVMVDEITKLLK